MRVARSLTVREVAIERVDDPLAAAGEVVCRMVACGVCRSDVTDWYVADRLPRVLGHELVGIVEQLGDGVTNVAVGETVAIHHHAPCGECRRCRRGHETLCERFRRTNVDPGGFAERVRVPVELVPELLPIGALDPVAATFVEPLACVVRALDRAGLRAGDALLIVGAGANGLLAITAAHALAVDAVWARDPREERLRRALELGAERHGNEQVDVALVCTPEPVAIATAAEHVAPGGMLCLYAPLVTGSELPIDGGMLFERELQLTASYSAGASDMRAALELLASGRVDPLPLVTHRLPLEQTGEALELVRSGQALKAVVLP